MINVTNFTSKNNPSYILEEAVPPTRPAVPAAPSKPRRAAAPALRVRLGGILVIAAGVLLSWPGAAPRRLGDRLFAMNDDEAYWRGWQIIKVQGGLGRRYRDSRFDTLAACGKCAGSGSGTRSVGGTETGSSTRSVGGAPCGQCFGTGRVSLDGVS